MGHFGEIGRGLPIGAFPESTHENQFEDLRSVEKVFGEISVAGFQSFQRSHAVCKASAYVFHSVHGVTVLYCTYQTVHAPEVIVNRGRRVSCQLADSPDIKGLDPSFFNYLTRRFYKILSVSFATDFTSPHPITSAFEGIGEGLNVFLEELRGRLPLREGLDNCPGKETEAFHVELASEKAFRLA